MAITTTYDSELRNNGLPFMVPMRRWKNNVLWRSTPVLLYLLIANAISVLLYDLIFNQHQQTEAFTEIITNIFPLLAIGILLTPLLVVVPLWLIARQRPVLQKIITTSTFLAIAFLIGKDILAHSYDTALWQTLTCIIVVLLCWLGMFSILRWSVATSILQFKALSNIAAKILPVSFMIVIFGYFSAEFWQMTAKLSYRNLIFFFLATGAIALITSLSVARSEIGHDKQLQKTLQKRSNSHATSSIQMLRKINVYFVIAATQMIQGLIFFVLFTVLLMLIGKIVLDPAVIAKWSEQALVAMSAGKVTLPFTLNELYTAAFASTFSTLNMMVSAATDKEYRTYLFDPVLDNIRALLQKH